MSLLLHWATCHFVISVSPKSWLPKAMSFGGGLGFILHHNRPVSEWLTASLCGSTSDEPLLYHPENRSVLPTSPQPLRPGDPHQKKKFTWQFSNYQETSSQYILYFKKYLLRIQIIICNNRKINFP